MWMITGIISVITTIIALLMAVNQNKKKVYISVTAITFLVITLLLQYNQVNVWVMKEDWSALMDVIPSMNGILCGYTVIILLANGVAMAIKNK